MGRGIFRGARGLVPRGQCRGARGAGSRRAHGAPRGGGGTRLQGFPAARVETYALNNFRRGAWAPTAGKKTVCPSHFFGWSDGKKAWRAALSSRANFHRGTRTSPKLRPGVFQRSRTRWRVLIRARPYRVDTVSGGLGVLFSSLSFFSFISFFLRGICGFLTKDVRPPFLGWAPGPRSCTVAGFRRGWGQIIRQRQ